LLCKAANIESCIKNLRTAIDEIKNAEVDIHDPKQIIFKNMIIGIIERKMTFIGSENPMLEFVQWCCDNGYLQQTVTFLKESIIKDNYIEGEYILNSNDYRILRVLRNSINHAEGAAVYKPEEKQELARHGVIYEVNKLLDDPELIFGFANKLLNIVREKAETQ
jgi:hypothetical protein